ncbi:MAG: pirin family protein [Gemmatimonadetes bacterium]|nr:pirin family protein [Gemmatimonadota bacterium]
MLEGEGFLVHRPFPTRELSDIDPFLLLDEMGPVELGPGEAKGAPDHPHRGFETVTYMLEGIFEHKDSAGNSGKLRPGDVQWMTAGAGVIHSEMPERAFAAAGGRMHAFQLWVNLPRRDKMTTPRYQEIPSGGIPVARSGDGAITVKVIAGEALGARAVIETRTPILYLHVTLEAGAGFTQPVPREYNAFTYEVEGEGRGQATIYARDGDAVAIEAQEWRRSVLLIGGVPLGEPVVRYGPFVMNTKDEIRQAIEDFQSGRMGRIVH